MALGPIEMVVIEFPESNFSGNIRPELAKLVENGIVDIVDALLVRKHDNGDLTVLEIEEVGGEYAELVGELGRELDLVSAEDAEELANELSPGSSALIIVFEHTWMKPVRDAVTESGGVLLADLHIPSDVVDSVLAAVEQA